MRHGCCTDEGIVGSAARYATLRQLEYKFPVSARVQAQVRVVEAQTEKIGLNPGFSITF